MTLEQIQDGQIFLVDKPLDWTSFQVVNKMKFKLKREFKLRKIKIGHAGTLDPKATGLLVVCIEKPEILLVDYQHITKDLVENALGKFLGEIEQKPPIFSAIKVDGERAYNLARAGQEVEVKSRKITIHYIKEIQINFPKISFIVGCSKGTYIRSLAHDIGQELGVGAYLTQLRRTKIGQLFVENASDDFLENEFEFSKL